MKRILLFIILGSALGACNSNDATHNHSTEAAATNTGAPDSASYTKMIWIDSLHQDLGKVKDGSVVEISWRFKNTGDKPLIVSNVNASCGCTVADKPEEPIAPGGEGVIRAKFDSKDRPGVQRKDVYVATNTSRDPQQLSFAVTVEK
jgi:hypothetical protein